MKTPVVLILGMTLAAQNLLAVSSYVNQIPNGATFSCANCHVNPAGGGTRTGFGNAFANNSHLWNATLAALDSDGDGYSNGVELADPNGTWRTGQPNPSGTVYNPGDATSHPSTTVTAPTITTQPVSQTVVAGANVTFTVGATGTAPLSYQWQKNSVNISGATSSSLTLAAVTSASSGSYRAIVSNSAGSATSAAATLTVTTTATAPSITTQPVSQSVNAGANVTFTVGATGTAPLSYQWQFNSLNISGATSSSLTLTAVTSANAGSYRAIVSNSAGSATSTAATLTVNTPVVAPTIATQPVSQTVTAGANVTFTVGATGTAPLSYQWQFNSVNISGATSSSLTLTSVTSANAGSYRAIVSNSAGSATSAAATLTVNAVGTPTITSQPVSQTVTAGATATFTVGATGTAPLSYQWMMNSANISGATTSGLTLNNVTTANAGSYTVRVSNSAGSVTSAAATLTVNPAVGAAAGTLVLGWNNLGMHCMDKDFSVFSILPPYNTIEAQLIVNGALVTSGNGYTVTYEAVADPSGSINRTAQGKTDFYQYTPYLYGALPMDMGLKGWAMPGPNNVPQGMLFENNNSPASGVSTPVNWFRAEGIPITPYDDVLQKNEYPLMRIVARDSAKNIIAANDVVVPVSDEMDCRACHASGTGTAMPLEGWVNDPNPERDYRLNILRLHDELQDPSTYPGILSSNGFSPQGLYYDVVTTGQPVLCAKCHLSEALQGSGYGNLPPLTTAIHSLHAGVTDPITGTTLDSAVNRTACYRCHPGSSTKCLRGAMGTAVAANGTMEMQCQSCHGNLSKVGNSSRVGWFMEPNCQSCHTGTAASNNGQIRYTSCFDASGNVRVAVNQTFATTPNTPATGLSLYRFSAGHGGLQCSACHGSTHAEFPTSEPNDNIRNTELQGHAGPMVECSACHATVPTTSNGGPHGMHPVGSAWVSAHPSYVGSACQACHGTDYRGTVLSEMQADRTLAGRGLFRGAIISCYICHNGPGGSGTPPASPTVSNVSASTAAGQPAAMTLPISGTGAYPRIISQPANGTVGLSTNGSSFIATYYPAAGFTGVDTFTFAAYNGYNNSSLATATVTVSSGPGSVPPTITTQPASRTVNAGANVTFSIVATGTAPLSYQWQKNSVNISGATGSSLTLTAVTTASAGSYRVIVSNSAGSVTSAAATLTVNTTVVAPTITTQPVSQTVNAGANVTFTVGATGTAPPSYQWQKNGVNITGATSSALTLTSVTSSSAGSYRAIVSNSAGSATSASATLTVITPLSVRLTSPVNGATYSQNSYVQITASVTSTVAIARVQFYDGSNLLGTDTSSPYTMTTRSLSRGTHSLTARATDVNGRSATSAPVQITIGRSSDN
jgi:Bacterial Ig domain/Immunoglobulin domain